MAEKKTINLGITKEHELCSAKIINARNAAAFASLRLDGVVAPESGTAAKEYVLFRAVDRKVSGLVKRLASADESRKKALEKRRTLEKVKKAGKLTEDENRELTALSAKVDALKALIESLTAQIAVGNEWLDENRDACPDTADALPCEELFFDALDNVLTGELSESLASLFAGVRKSAIEYHKADLCGSADAENKRLEFKTALNKAMERVEIAKGESGRYLSTRHARFDTAELRLCAELIAGFTVAVVDGGTVSIIAGREKQAARLANLLIIAKKQNVKLTAENVSAESDADKKEEKKASEKKADANKKAA